MDYKAEYERWLKLATDSEINAELESIRAWKFGKGA